MTVRPALQECQMFGCFPVLEMWNGISHCTTHICIYFIMYDNELVFFHTFKDLWCFFFSELFISFAHFPLGFCIFVIDFLECVIHEKKLSRDWYFHISQSTENTTYTKPVFWKRWPVIIGSEKMWFMKIYPLDWGRNFWVFWQDYFWLL